MMFEKVPDPDVGKAISDYLSKHPGEKISVAAIKGSTGEVLEGLATAILNASQEIGAKTKNLFFRLVTSDEFDNMAEEVVKYPKLVKEPAVDKKIVAATYIAMSLAKKEKELLHKELKERKLEELTDEEFKEKFSFLAEISMWYKSSEKIKEKGGDRCTCSCVRCTSMYACVLENFDKKSIDEVGKEIHRVCSTYTSE